MGGAPIVKKWETQHRPRGSQAHRPRKGGVNHTTLLQTRNKPEEQTLPNYPGLPRRDWPSIADSPSFPPHKAELTPRLSTEEMLSRTQRSWRGSC